MGVLVKTLTSIFKSLISHTYFIEDEDLDLNPRFVIPHVCDLKQIIYHVCVSGFSSE